MGSEATKRRKELILGCVIVCVFLWVAKEQFDSSTPTSHQPPPRENLGLDDPESTATRKVMTITQVGTNHQESLTAAPPEIKARVDDSPKEEDEPTTKEEQERWIHELLGTWIDSSSFDKLSSLTDEEFCEAQVARVWDMARKRLPKTLIRALEDHKKRHEAVAAGKPYPNQKYLVWSLSGGVGNRFLALASTFMTAVLSKRVFLMKDWFAKTWVKSEKAKPVFLMAPKEVGGYRLEELDKLFNLTADSEGVERSLRSGNHRLICPFVPMMSLTDFRLQYPEKFKGTRDGGKSNLEHIMVDIRHRHDKNLERWNRFMCGPLAEDDSEKSVKQSGLDAAFFPQEFVYIWTNQYFLPGMFSNPFFSERMRKFFPDPEGSGIHQVGPYESIIRLLAIPARAVTLQVHKFFHQTPNFEEQLLKTGNHGRLIVKPYTAAHVRAFHKPAIQPLGAAFDMCLGKTKRRPPGGNSDGAQPFFLASMHSQVIGSFKKKYGRDNILTWTPATDDQSTGDTTGDQNALADMILLSLSTNLYVSGGSTFGMFASALGGLAPILITNVKPGQGQSECIPSSKHDVMMAEQHDTAPQPCFGSWFRYDKLFHRSKVGMSCELKSLPNYSMRCKG